MIELPKIDERYQYKDDTGEFYPCVICGRPVKNPNHKSLRIVDGGGVAALEHEVKEMYELDRDKAAAGDLYFYPIGNECLRRYPQLKEYAKPFNEEIY